MAKKAKKVVKKAVKKVLDKTNLDEKLVAENKYNNCGLRGTTIRVKPNDKHGGTFGKEGGIFFSVQKWLNGVEPHCVAADYIGKTMGDHHLKSVKCGDAYFDSPLKPADALKSDKKKKWEIKIIT